MKPMEDWTDFDYWGAYVVAVVGDSMAQAGGGPISIGAAFVLGVRLSMEHPEYARALYRATSNDESAAVSERIAQMVADMPVAEEQ